MNLPLLAVAFLMFVLGMFIVTNLYGIAAASAARTRKFRISPMFPGPIGTTLVGMRIWGFLLIFLATLLAVVATARK